MKPTRSRKTSLLLVGWTLALLVPCCPAHSLGQEDPSTEKTEKKVEVRLEKIALRYVRVEDMANALGFPVIVPQKAQAVPGKVLVNPGALAASHASALLPPGIVQIYGYAWDNTIVTQGGTDSIRELKQLIVLLDVPIQQMEIHAEAVLTLTDKAGQSRSQRMTADGHALGAQPLSLKVGYRGGASPRHIGVKEGNYRVEVEAQLLSDGTIRLDYHGKMAYILYAPGLTTSIYLDKDVRGGGIAGKGRALTLIHSTVQFDVGAAEMTLKLTPRVLESATAQAPKEKVHAGF